MEFKNTIQAMQKLGGNVVKDGKNILNKEKKAGGTLYNDFDYLVTASKNSVTLEFEFGKADDYWAFVDEGVKGAGGFKGSGRMRGQGSPFRFGSGKYKGKWPQFTSAIQKWIKKKGIKGRNKETGKFITNKSLGFLIQRAIYQRGLTRTQFFSRPFKSELNKQTDAILNAFGKDLDKELEIIIGK
tara:strand:- start:535 stop:1089 length:555 start_codon:yes stop_codon:yes gene_type:complete